MRTRASILLLLCTALATHAQVRISELPEATNAAGAQFVIIQGGATKRIAEGTVRTIPATNVTGLGPFAISTNLAISNITGLQGALDGKLATNGTLPAGNITGLGPFATATNLIAAQIDDFSNAVVAVAPPTTNASLLTTGTLEDARLSTNIARTSQLVASNIGGLGPFATATNLASSNISDFSAAVTAAAPATTNAAALTTGTLNDARLSTNVVLQAQLGPFATATNLTITNVTGLQSALDGKLATNGTLSASNVVGAAWALQTLSHSFYNTSGYTLAAGRNVQLNLTFPAIGATGTVTLPRQTTDGAQNGDDLFVVATGLGQGQTLVIERFVYTGSSYLSTTEVAVTATNNSAWRFRLLNGLWTVQPVGFHEQPASTILGLGPFATATNLLINNITGLQSALDAKLATNGTLPATNITGLGPFARVTNLAITNVTGLQSALDGKLATNGTLPANNITGLGPFATATNLTSTNISDFSAAVTAAATATTNAAALTTGTLNDARLSTNVVLQAQLGPFARATNLAITNVTGLQSALDGKLATNGTLPANNITGLGPFATATNLTSTNISDFSAAVTALAPATTNASLLTSGTLADARLSTNVVLSSNPALTNARSLATDSNGSIFTDRTGTITFVNPVAWTTNVVAATRTNLGLGALATNNSVPSGAAPSGSALQADGSGGSAFVASRIQVATLNSNIVRTNWPWNVANQSSNRIVSVSLDASSLYLISYVAKYGQTNASVTLAHELRSDGGLALVTHRAGWGQSPNTTLSFISFSGGTNATSIPLPSAGALSNSIVLVAGETYVNTASNSVTLFYQWTTPTNTSNAATLYEGTTLRAEKIYP